MTGRIWARANIFTSTIPTDKYTTILMPPAEGFGEGLFGLQWNVYLQNRGKIAYGQFLALDNIVLASEGDGVSFVFRSNSSSCCSGNVDVLPSLRVFIIAPSPLGILPHMHNHSRLARSSNPPAPEKPSFLFPLRSLTSTPGPAGLLPVFNRCNGNICTTSNQPSPLPLHLVYRANLRSSPSPSECKFVCK